MKPFDKFILENFAKYCVKNNIDMQDHTNLRLAAATFCSEISTTVINFVEWSIEDDCNNNTYGSAAVQATEGSTHD